MIKVPSEILFSSASDVVLECKYENTNNHTTNVITFFLPIEIGYANLLFGTITFSILLKLHWFKIEKYLRDIKVCIGLMNS